MKRKGIVLCVLCFFLGACALPPSAKEEQIFIPDNELSTVSLVKEGLYFFSRSRYFDAEIRFRQALCITPDADNIKLNLAVVLDFAGQTAEAEELYQDLLERRGDDTRVLAGVARLYAGTGRFEVARRFYEEAYDTAIEEEEWARAAQFARSLAALAFQFGDEATALCFSTQAAALISDPQELARHARLLVAGGFYDKVKRDFSSFSEGHGASINGELLHVLAMAQYGLGDMKESVHLEDLVQDRAKSNPGIEAEAGLVRFAALGFRHEAPTEEGSAEGDEPDPEDEELSDPVENIYQSGELPIGARLYWPVNLIEAVIKYATEKGFGEE